MVCFYCTRAGGGIIVHALIRKEHEEVTIDDLAGFIACLKYPAIHQKVVPLLLEPVHRAQTINNILNTVIALYDYLLRHDAMESHLSEKLVKFIWNSSSSYRSFLYGIAENKREKRAFGNVSAGLKLPPVKGAEG